MLDVELDKIRLAFQDFQGSISRVVGFTLKPTVLKSYG